MHTFGSANLLANITQMNVGVTSDEQANGKQDSASAGLAKCQAVQGARKT